jgi:hypothetical protein
MRIVEDFEVVNTGKEKLARFFEGYAVLLPIRQILGVIPDHLHSRKCKPTTPYQKRLTPAHRSKLASSIQSVLGSIYDASLAA